MPKKNPNSSSLQKIFRDQLFMSQAELAEYLNVSKPLLCMAEAGKRNLPRVPRTKFMNLLKTLESKKEGTGQHTDILKVKNGREEKLVKELNFVIHTLQKRIIKKEVELAALRNSTDGLNAWITMIDDLLDRPGDGNPRAGLEKVWLNEQRRKAMERAGKTGKYELLFLEAKIKLLKEEVKAWGSFLARYMLKAVKGD